MSEAAGVASEGVAEDAGLRQAFFASQRAVYDPVFGWMIARFGPGACHHGTWKYASVDVGGVTVSADVSDSSTAWRVGYGGGKAAMAGVSRHGAGWEDTIPSAVRLAADFVRLKGASGGSVGG